MDAYNITDPYRYTFPNKKEYTYIPFGNRRKNRSRLDFYLISERLLDQVNSIDISTNCISSHFDHKAVSISFAKPDNLVRQKRELAMCNNFLENRYLTASCTYAAVNFLNNTFVQDQAVKIGRAHV